MNPVWIKRFSDPTLTNHWRISLDKKLSESAVWERSQKLVNDFRLIKLYHQHQGLQIGSPHIVWPVSCFSVLKNYQYSKIKRFPINSLTSCLSWRGKKKKNEASATLGLYFHTVKSWLELRSGHPVRRDMFPLFQHTPHHSLQPHQH